MSAILKMRMGVTMVIGLGILDTSSRRILSHDFYYHDGLFVTRNSICKQYGLEVVF